MAGVDQQQQELAEKLAAQIAEAFGVECIAVESTAKGVRLKTLRVHRHDNEPWSAVVQRTADVYEKLEQELGQLV